MISLSADRLATYRAATFRLAPDQRLKSRDEAVEYVNQRGFVHFWPIRGVLLPSLWVATAGDRPVADEHDDPGHITWRWKDSLLGSQQWYYAKILRKKATMISTPVAPNFYALSQNYGSPEDDYLTLYEQGRLTQEAKAIYEVILDQGPLDTIALRKAARLSSPENESRFNKALADLQSGFQLVPVAVAEVGAWRYAFAYDIVARHYPELPELAHHISERQARRELAKYYFRSLGAARLEELARLFGWQMADARSAVDDLVSEGALQSEVQLENQPGSWIVLAELC
jgi:hypothetical protein